MGRNFNRTITIDLRTDGWELIKQPYRNPYWWLYNLSEGISTKVIFHYSKLETDDPELHIGYDVNIPIYIKQMVMDLYIGGKLDD